MAFSAYFDPATWARVPFHFWSVVFFIFGTVVGSFLNVCIHRMPLGESVVFPPSHCPHCRYSIPWFLNLPLATWLYLRGRCANCGAPFSIRYFLVELLTGVLFLGSWLCSGHDSPAVAFVDCILIAGLIVATFIDLEHLIIPDEITLGGVGAGLLASFLVPRLHQVTSLADSLQQSFIGALFGGGLVYGVLRAGKWAFGREVIPLPPASRVIFSETALVLDDRQIPYEEVFYRDSDVVKLRAERAELFDRCYLDVEIRLSPSKLSINEEEFEPENVPYLEVTTSKLYLPREAMGLGDAKFMAGIGAFLGWPGVVFSLFASSVLGSIIGITIIAVRRQSRSTQIPYGPYIALAALIWIFAHTEIVRLFHLWIGR